MTKTLSHGRGTAGAIAQLFLLSESGANRVVVSLEATGGLAGTIVRGSRGYITTDENAAPIGVFETADDALRGIYDAL